MKSRVWWNETKRDPQKLEQWLKDQYHGEIMAHKRIIQFAKQYAPKDGKWANTLKRIAGQELKHAKWVAKLLLVRGMTPKVLQKKERYWKATLKSIDDFASGAAVAAHAERMRLLRITVIARDPEAPKDIREVFLKILPEENFHAKAFAAMAGDKAMAEAFENHRKGMRALGLIPDEGF